MPMTTINGALLRSLERPYHRSVGGHEEQSQAARHQDETLSVRLYRLGGPSQIPRCRRNSSWRTLGAIGVTCTYAAAAGMSSVIEFGRRRNCQLADV